MKIINNKIYNYTLTENYDKYGRLTEATGLVRNAYDVDPTCTDGTYDVSGVNNGSSRLASSTDLTTGEVTRYAYVKDRVSKIGTFSSTGTKLSESEIDYDSIGRITSNEFVYGNKSTKKELGYVTEANSVNTDSRISEYTFSINNSVKVSLANTYDELKRLSKKVVDVGNIEATLEYGYDYTRLCQASHTIKVGNNIVKSHIYLWNCDSHLRTTIEHDYVSGGYTNTYVYDSFGQLVRENNEVLDKTFVYSYNGIGNITSVKTYAYTTAATPSGTPTTTSFGYSVDKLTSFGINSISYDSMGCPTSVGNKKYVWDKGRLVRIYDDVDENDSISSEDIRFTYNAYGQRISKTYSYDPGENYDGDFLVSSTTTYTYDNIGRLIREYCTESYYESDDQTREFIYLYDDSGITGVMYSKNGSAASLYYYDRNHRGDVIAIYDSNGNRKSGYAYDAYGNCTVTYSGDWDLTQRNPIRYRGYYYDRETGLYYLNARYYNSQWRRFISPDSPDYLDPETPNGLNLYAYCNNDPVNYADPSGNSIVSLIIGLVSSVVIGGLISGGIATLPAILSGGDIGAAFLGGFVTGALSALAVGVGMAIGGGIGLLVCGGIGFAAGFIGNLTSQFISSYRETGYAKIKIGDAIFSGVTNSLVCMATMVGMDSSMSDSFSPALSGNTFGSRFVEFMSFDCANTMYSTYFGIMFGLFDCAFTLIKYLIELEMSKSTTAVSLLVNC